MRMMKCLHCGKDSLEISDQETPKKASLRMEKRLIIIWKVSVDAELVGLRRPMTNGLYHGG